MSRPVTPFTHIWRLLALFALAKLVFAGIRRIFVPKSYGQIGRYRAAALDDEAARPLRHAGRQACKACHEEVWRLKSGSAHKGVHCESCHGPALAHVGDPARVKPRKPSGSEIRPFCTRCHGVNPSKPKSFPQIDPVRLPDAIGALESRQGGRPWLSTPTSRRLWQHRQLRQR